MAGDAATTPAAYLDRLDRLVAGGHYQAALDFAVEANDAVVPPLGATRREYRYDLMEIAATAVDLTAHDE